ncbi:MAG: hypothetical protein ACM3P0_09695, partial [Acidobacteriota bacterium]
ASPRLWGMAGVSPFLQACRSSGALERVGGGSSATDKSSLRDYEEVIIIHPFLVIGHLIP